MNPIGSAALIDVSLALCVILSFVGLGGLVMSCARWVRDKLEARAAEREIGERLASAEEPQQSFLHTVNGPDQVVWCMGAGGGGGSTEEKLQVAAARMRAAALYTIEDCRRRAAECLAMSEDGKARMAEHLKAAQGTGGMRRKVILGYLEAEACRMRRGKQWSDQWALLAEALEDAEEDQRINEQVKAHREAEAQVDRLWDAAVAEAGKPADKLEPAEAFEAMAQVLRKADK